MRRDVSDEMLNLKVTYTQAMQILTCSLLGMTHGMLTREEFLGIFDEIHQRISNAGRDKFNGDA